MYFPSRVHLEGVLVPCFERIDNLRLFVLHHHRQVKVATPSGHNRRRPLDLRVPLGRRRKVRDLPIVPILEDNLGRRHHVDRPAALELAASRRNLDQKLIDGIILRNPVQPHQLLLRTAPANFRYRQRRIVQCLHLDAIPECGGRLPVLPDLAEYNAWRIKQRHLLVQAYLLNVFRHPRLVSHLGHPGSLE